MELFERKKRIEQSLMSVLDYCQSESIVYSGGILCLEALVHSIPCEIDINVITRDQLEKRFGDRIGHLRFDSLELVSQSIHISNEEAIGIDKLTYMASVIDTSHRMINNMVYAGGMWC